MVRFPRFRDFLRARDGAVTIEFVVTLPIFLIALAFAFEFGQFFLAHQSTVNNVRSAARYLSRTDAAADDITRATNIVKTGRAVGGVTPTYLEDATININPNYQTFTAPTFTRSGKTLRIRAVVDVPLTIFGFIDSADRPSMRFVVVEDLRYVGV